MSNKNELVKLIMNQTNYDRDLALQKLEEWDDNYINVIKEYLNPNFQNKKEKKKLSNNQKIITSIRNFMDKASINYEKKKRYMEFLRRKKEMEADIIREGKEQEDMYNKKLDEQKIEEDKKKRTKDEEERNQTLNENITDGIEIDEVN
jgi:hypothetical protein